MFGLITRRRHQEETDALRAQVAGLRAERDNALEERDAFKTAAKTACEQVAAVPLGELLAEGGRVGHRVRPAEELLRERDRVRALERHLATLQAANMRCTCGGAA